MKIAVTGGSGLAGFAVVKHLLDCGHEVISIDRVPLPQALTEYRLVDCGDLGQVYGAFSGVDSIAHLAAIPRPTFHTPEVVFRTNMMATFNVFEVAAVLEIPRIVNFSSESVLGQPFNYSPVQVCYAPIDEAHPKAPQDAYALSKTLGEDIAEAFVRRMAGKLSVVSLRFPWIHTPETFRDQVMRYQDNPAGGAANLWTYVDTRDVAQACQLALESTISGHDVFFVAAKNSFMKHDTAALVREFYPEAKIRKELVGNQSLLDTSKARAVLGYEAHYSWEDYEWS